jgi:hypothetical protein
MTWAKGDNRSERALLWGAADAAVMGFPQLRFEP